MQLMFAIENDIVECEMVRESGRLSGPKILSGVKTVPDKNGDCCEIGSKYVIVLALVRAASRGGRLLNC